MNHLHLGNQCAEVIGDLEELQQQPTGVVHFPQPQTPTGAYALPVMGHAAVKEQDRAAWINTLAGAPSIAATAAQLDLLQIRASHETGDLRYLAIPFFDACLAMRLPTKGSKSQNLRPVDMSQAWLAPFLSQTVSPRDAFQTAVEPGQVLSGWPAGLRDWAAVLTSSR